MADLQREIFGGSDDSDLSEDGQIVIIYFFLNQTETGTLFVQMTSVSHVAVLALSLLKKKSRNLVLIEMETSRMRKHPSFPSSRKGTKHQQAKASPWPRAVEGTRR